VSRVIHSGCGGVQEVGRKRVRRAGLQGGHNLEKE
jgi:hypothetical protein